MKKQHIVSPRGLAALALCLSAALADPARAEEARDTRDSRGTTQATSKPSPDAGSLRVAPKSGVPVVSGVPGGLSTDLPAARTEKPGRAALDQPGCTICLDVPASVTWAGNSGSFHAERIANHRASLSGPLDLKVALTAAQPVLGQNISSYAFSSTLNFSALSPGFQYSPIDSGTISFFGNTIPAGEYFQILFLRENVSGSFFYTDFVLMNRKVSCNGSGCSLINPPAGCVEDTNTVCLAGGRYRATGRWKNQYAGGAQANLSKAKLTDVTGAFWIADANTYEFVVRINTATNNGRAWVSILTFTDVEFWVAITDVTNGQTKEYHSDPGNRTLIYDPTFFVYP